MWPLNVNIKKCKVVIFNSAIKKEPTFIFLGNPIELSQSYCYLGLELTSGVSFKSARNNLIKKKS